MKSMCAVVLAVGLPAAAFAQGRIETVYSNGSSGAALVHDPTLESDHGYLGGPAGDSDMDVLGLDQSVSIRFSYDTAPFSGVMGGHTNLSYGPASSPGIGGNFSDIYFDGSTFSNTGGGQAGYNGNFCGNTIVSMVFTVDEATSWSWAADLTGAATGYAQATYQMYLRPVEEMNAWDGQQFLPSGDFLAFDAASAEETGAFDLHTEQGGVLEAGTYFLRIEIYSNAGLQFGPGAGEASVALTNGLFHLGGPVPAPAASALLLLTGLTAARRARRA